MMMKFVHYGKFTGKLFVAFLAVIWLTGAASMTPTQRVQNATNDILAVLKNDSFNREEKWKHVGAVINRSFDFQSMSQSILATNWRTATPEEKRRFVEYFSQYLEDVYRTKIESYSNQRIEYREERVVKNRAIVKTFIITDSTEIPITYKLKNNDGEWFAYDVVIEGISLVSNYRDTFGAILKTEGMAGLLRNLEGRIASYKTEHGIVNREKEPVGVE